LDERQLRTLGQWMRRIRVKAGYASQAGLAAASGISTATISRLEAGLHMPTPETLLQLSEALRVPHEELMRAAGYIDIKRPTNNEYLENECRRLLAENARLHEENANLKAAIANLTAALMTQEGR